MVIIFHAIRWMVGLYLAYTASMPMLNNWGGVGPEPTMSITFLWFVWLLGMFMMYKSLRGIGVGQSRIPEGATKTIHLGFEMETLESGQKTMDQLQKLLTRAIQVKKCKMNTDIAAFEQAAKEVAEVEAMNEEKNSE